MWTLLLREYILLFLVSFYDVNIVAGRTTGTMEVTRSVQRWVRNSNRHHLMYVFFQVTQGFLEYTKGQGNDLSTPRGGFPGLKPGDMWCLCAARWRQVGARHVWPCFLPVTQFVSWLLFSEKSFSLSLQAMLAGSAPRVVAAATHQASLQVEKSWCQNF